MRRYWKHILFAIVVPITIFLIIPTTRAILISFAIGEPFTPDGMPARLHVEKLSDPDPKVAYESLQELLSSEKCAVFATPEIAIYFQSLRKRGEEVSEKTITTILGTIEKSSDESVQKMAPALGAMLQCEAWSPPYRATLLKTAVRKGARHESLTAAAVKMLSSRHLVTINAAGEALSTCAPDVLKAETRKLLFNEDRQIRTHGAMVISDHCPNAEDCAKRLEEMLRSEDSTEKSSASGALRRIGEYQRSKDR